MDESKRRRNPQRFHDQIMRKHTETALGGGEGHSAMDILTTEENMVKDAKVGEVYKRPRLYVCIPIICTRKFEG